MRVRCPHGEGGSRHVFVHPQARPQKVRDPDLLSTVEALEACLIQHGREAVRIVDDHLLSGSRKDTEAIREEGCLGGKSRLEEAALAGTPHRALGSLAQHAGLPRPGEERPHHAPRSVRARHGMNAEQVERGGAHPAGELLDYPRGAAHGGSVLNRQIAAIVGEPIRGA